MNQPLIAYSKDNFLSITCVKVLTSFHYFVITFVTIGLVTSVLGVIIGSGPCVTKYFCKFSILPIYAPTPAKTLSF